MPSPVVFDPGPVLDSEFPHVFVFPPQRIFDPQKNVLLVANLWDFAIGKAEALPDHRLWLGKRAARLLTKNKKAGARLIGLASRTGSDEYNFELGMRRAREVETILGLFVFAGDLVNPPDPPPRITVGSQGEHFAALEGEANGTEDARFRSVLVTILADRAKPTMVRLLRAYGTEGAKS